MKIWGIIRSLWTEPKKRPTSQGGDKLFERIQSMENSPTEKKPIKPSNRKNLEIESKVDRRIRKINIFKKAVPTQSNSRVTPSRMTEKEFLHYVIHSDKEIRGMIEELVDLRVAVSLSFKVNYPQKLQELYQKIESKWSKELLPRNYKGILENIVKVKKESMSRTDREVRIRRLVVEKEFKKKNNNQNHGHVEL